MGEVRKFAGPGAEVPWLDFAEKRCASSEPPLTELLHRSLALAKALESGDEAWFEKNCPAFVEAPEVDARRMREVKKIRDAGMSAALLAGFESIACGSSAISADTVRRLVKALGDAGTPAQPGLALERMPANSYDLNKVLIALDGMHGTQLQSNPNQDQSLTAATAIIALDWLTRLARRKDGSINVQRLLTAIVTGELRSVRGSGNGTNCTLPTSKEKALDFALYGHPWMAQLLRFNPGEHVSRADYRVRRFRSSHMGEIPREPYFWNGHETGTAWHKDVCWSGLTITSIYIAVLIERLGILELANMEQDNAGPSADETPPEDLPPELVDAVPMAHWETVATAITPEFPYDFQVYLSSESTAAEAGVSADELSPVCELKLKQLKLKAPHHSCPESIGSILLPAGKPYFDRPVMWFDVLIVAKLNGQWHVVPAICEDDPEDDQRTELIVAPLNPDERWPLERLRQALEKSRWAYQHNGLGVFIAGALDLDA